MNFEAYSKGYANLWQTSAIAPSKASYVASIAKAITTDTQVARAVAVQRDTAIPAGLILALNYRESGGSFTTYLGNGQRLDRVTTEVPAGRGPFETWEQGAIDALRLQRERPAEAWSIEYALWWAEGFNGRGYEKHDENSPYIWALTNHQQPGMFTTDHGYDRSAVDTRPGIAALFRAFQISRPQLMLPTLQQIRSPTMTTAPTVTTTDPLAEIVKALDLAKNTLPFFARLIPPPFSEIALVGVPAVEDFIQFIEEARTTGISQDHFADLLNNLAAHLQTLAKQIKPQATT